MDHFSRRRTLLAGASALVAQSMLPGCSRKPPTIGLMLDDMRVARWASDRDFFFAAAKKLGAVVHVKWANGDEAGQVNQLLRLIETKVDVIVLLPLNGKLFKDAVAKAKEAGIKVIAYDRMVFDADIDAYVSVDNAEIGRLQAEAIVKQVPKGNYYLLGGSETDGNARQLREIHQKVIKPYVDRGDIKVVGSSYVAGWDPNVAQEIMARVFEGPDQIDAVIASNDGTAGGVVEVLKTRGLAGKVPVSGQDADLDACKRVIAGTQTMTVYKHLKDLATMAADLAFAMADGDEPELEGETDNGLKKVKTKFLKPTLITKANVDILVKDGVYTREQLGL